MSTPGINIGSVNDSIKSLIDKYEKLRSEKGDKELKNITESNVRSNFIDPLFEALGWAVRDLHEYDSEHHIRSVGFADVALKIDGKICVFVEAKRFGGIPSRTVQTTITGQKILADWTDEERQVLHYAVRSLDSKWGYINEF